MTHDSLPRSLFAYPPLIWSRVLFPGQANEPGRWSWPALLFFLFVPAIVLYPCMSFYLFEPDEGRYAQIPREMLARGDWIVPILQGEPYLDKPPLFYWLVMVSYSIFGVHDWAARLVPALAVHGTILLTYLFGRRSLGNRPAFLGALVLMLAPGFTAIGRLLILDGVLSFFVALSIFTAFEAIRARDFRQRWWIVSSVACGLGILAKGPVAIVLTLPPIWLYERCSAAPGGLRGAMRRSIVHSAIALAIALPWYALVTLRLPEFAYHFLWEHNVLRFFAPFDHLRSVWFYVPLIALGFLPVTLLFVSFMRFIFSSEEKVRELRSPQFGFMLLAAGWGILFFSLSGCKLPTYILPAMPFLALAVGYFLAHTSWHRSKATWSGAAVAFTILVAGHYWAVPQYAHYRSPMKHADAVVAECSDKDVPVVCYPRPVDSVAFYLGRDDLKNYRSKNTPSLLHYLEAQDTAVVLFSHRHSLKQLTDVLPKSHYMARTSKMGLCDMAVVQRRTHGARPVGLNQPPSALR